MTCAPSASCCAATVWPRRPRRCGPSSPPWLADELTRSWVGQWPSLPDAMDEAAAYVAPTCGELERLTVPMGVAAATDDPVHPVEVGVEWVSAAPRAALRTVTLEQMGADPAVLGAACVAALLEACDFGALVALNVTTAPKSLTAGDGPQLLHGRSLLAAASGRLRCRRRSWPACPGRPAGPRPVRRRPAVGSPSARATARQGACEPEAGCLLDEPPCRPTRFEPHRPALRWCSCAPLTTQRIIQR